MLVALLSLFISLLAVYLAADIFMTVACFASMSARDASALTRNNFEEWVDGNYTDRFIAARFQNMVVESTTQQSE